jgi:hypothetical protein
MGSPVTAGSSGAESGVCTSARSSRPAPGWSAGSVGDIVMLHDPQTAGLAPALRAAGARVVCRLHVGAEHANVRLGAARDFLRSYAASADAIVFTR